MRTQSLEFLKALVRAPSPSGFEQPAARVYREYLNPFADRITTDIHGNVSAVVNPDAELKIMLAGHMDEIGFIIHHISDEGLIYFQGIGDHDGAVPVGQRVWIHGRERIAGVVGSTAIHLQGGAERSKRPKIRHLWIDIGATSRKEAEAVVRLGDVVTYQAEFQILLSDRAAARGFDNKMGCFIVAEALRLLKVDGGLHPGVGVSAIATVQEEIGHRGAQSASYATGAQTGLAIDVDHATDHADVSSTRYGEVEIGGGPTITRDPILSPVVYDLIQQAASADDIPCQVVVSSGSTGTDADVMQLARRGIATGLLGVPLRYMHTPCEVLSLKDVENCARLVAAYCRRITPQTDFTPW